MTGLRWLSRRVGSNIDARILRVPGRREFLPCSPPLIGQEEIDEVTESLRSGWITTSPKAARFELEFRDFVRAEAALALSSCTAALLRGLIALGLRRAVFVISPPMSFASC